MENKGDYEVVMGCLDVKDAFLQVPQEEIVGVSLHGKELVIKRNLPGQYLGAKAWYWYFRNTLPNALSASGAVNNHV